MSDFMMSDFLMSDLFGSVLFTSFEAFTMIHSRIHAKIKKRIQQVYLNQISEIKKSEIKKSDIRHQKILHQKSKNPTSEIKKSEIKNHLPAPCFKILHPIAQYTDP